MPLSNVAVRNAKPKDKPYKLADEKGMYLEISPAGGKWWRLKYRIDGKEKRISLGVYPDVSLAEARGFRDEARKLLSKGIDPSAQKRSDKDQRQEKARNTFEAVARNWWAEHAPTWSESYARRILSRLEADVFPAIGALNIAELQPAHLRSMSETIRARGVTETARRALQDVGQVLIHADLPDISVSQRAKLPAYKVKHMAAVTDAKDVALLLRAIETYSGGIVVRSALRLAALVFVRPGELRAAQWADITLETSEWRYHVSKQGDCT